MVASQFPASRGGYIILTVGSLLFYLYLAISLTADNDCDRVTIRRPIVQEEDNIGRVLQLPSSSTTPPNVIPRFCIETSRCQKLNMSRRFSFVHISKASGASWIRELKNVLPSSNLFPQSEQGAEFSVVHQNSLNDFDFLSYHLISLRSPRHHVWSLFTECKYDEWGVETTTGTGFPRNGTTPEADLEDYRIWLNHFLGDDTNKTVPKKTRCYGCYQAANYQSNVLTSTARKPGRKNDKNPILEPDLELSQQIYESMNWVAMTEFFHESKCLFYFRLEPKTEQVHEYLQNTCHCSEQHNKKDREHGTASSTVDIHVTHHTHGRRTTMLDLPPDILQAVDALTRVDQSLYKFALHSFVREVVWLEAQLGHQVLCDHVLDRWEPELAYLNVSITSMYNHEKIDSRLMSKNEWDTPTDPF